MSGFIGGRSVSVSPSRPNQPPLHIGINAHLLSDEAGYRRAGIHQYIYQVLSHLPPDDNLRYTLYTRRAAEWAGHPALRPVGTRLPTANRLARIAWEQAVWPVLARRDRLSLLHSMAFALPRLAPCPAVVTIYDLSFVEIPDSFPAAQRRYLMAETAHACRRAARLITISESGRRDLHRVYGAPLERIDVVRPGAGAAYRPLPAADIAAFRRQQGLPDTFLLHVGTLQPRKNIPLLLEALARLNRPDVALVLVGGKGWAYDAIFERVAALGLTDRVRFAGYVADETLPLWYNAAAALVMPSLYEGFGLPVVEALACGTPVVAAGASSLPEAGGDVALYHDPRNPDDLAARLAQALDDPAIAARARAAGPAHAARFSWAAAGQETAAVYRRAAESPPRSAR